MDIYFWKKQACIFTAVFWKLLYLPVKMHTYFWKSKLAFPPANTKKIIIFSIWNNFGSIIFVSSLLRPDFCGKKVYKNRTIRNRDPKTPKSGKNRFPITKIRRILEYQKIDFLFGAIWPSEKKNSNVLPRFTPNPNDYRQT